MKIALSLSLFLLAAHDLACSKAIEEKNAGTPGLTPAETVAVNSRVNLQTTPAPTVQSNSTPDPRDVVLFDGKNYIKKSGWEVPLRDNTYVNESYDQGEVKRMTENGKQVKMNTVHYLYKTPWFHSQDFYYRGRDLDNMKGKLESGAFLEMNVDGKVFMYSIFAEKVVTSPPSNNDPHAEPFGYQIQDRDGDGIFETLLGEHAEIIVPNWVLK